MKTQLLRPGFMLALQTTMKGGTAYELHESEIERDGGMIKKHRDSTVTIFDTEEHERAVKVRGEARYCVTRLCVKTPFSLLCPEENEAVMDEGILAAKKMVADFNATSIYTKIGFYTMKGKILGNDEANAAAIAAEMRSLLAEMSKAIEKMDPDAIREAIKKANEVSSMLVEEQQEKVSAAIEMARVAAREIAKTVKKKGLGAVNVVTEYRAELAALKSAGNAFLDFEEPVAATDEVPGVQVKDLDLSDAAAPIEEYPDPVACKKAGVHMKSVDSDGYCNACGCQETSLQSLPSLDL